MLLRRSPQYSYALFLKLMLHDDYYNYHEDVANHFATGEDHDNTEQEIFLTLWT